MSDVVIATSQQDALAAERVVRHHAELAGTLSHLVERVVAASSTTDSSAAATARTRLVGWCRSELLPHAAAEEGTLYAAARDLDPTRLLVAAMTDEHQVIIGLVAEVDSARDAIAAAVAARALKAVVDSHLTKENDRLLPELVASPDHSVAALLEGMHEILGADESTPADEPQESNAAEATSSGCGGHTCGCDESAAAEAPELDARLVPHAIRHSTIFGALDAVPAGEAMVLVAPHDPVPLLMQLEERSPGAFQVSYLEQGPDAWRLRFMRRA